MITTSQPTTNILLTRVTDNGTTEYKVVTVTGSDTSVTPWMCTQQLNIYTCMLGINLIPTNTIPTNNKG